MGTFRIDCEVANLRKPGKAISVKRMLVDTGAEYSWIPESLLAGAGISVAKKDVAFLVANGKTITRHIGYAMLRAKEFETVDEVVFARKGDLRILGARTLEGFAAVVDARRKRLVASGPLCAAANPSDPSAPSDPSDSKNQIPAPAPGESGDLFFDKSVNSNCSFNCPSSRFATAASGF